MRYSVGFDVDNHVRAAANKPPEHCRVPCLSNTTGGAIDDLDCAEIIDQFRARLTQLGLADVDAPDRAPP